MLLDGYLKQELCQPSTASNNVRRRTLWRVSGGSGTLERGKELPPAAETAAKTAGLRG